MDLFNFEKPAFKFLPEVRMIELFAGIKTQTMACLELGINLNEEKSVVVEWNIDSIIAEAQAFSDDNEDWSSNYSKEEIIEILYQMGVSNDGDTPCEISV